MNSLSSFYFANKKLVLLSLLGFLALLLVIIFSTKTIVIVSNQDNQINEIVIAKDGIKKNISLKQHAQKVMFLNIGDYLISSQNKNQESTVSKHAGAFSINKFKLQTKPQKLSTSLGYQNSDCLIYDKNNPQLVFYSCGKNLPDSHAYTLTNDGLNYTDTVSGNMVNPYGAGTLQINNEGMLQNLIFSGNQVVNTVTSSTNLNQTSSQEPTQLSATNLTATDHTNAQNTRIAFYEEANKRVVVFDTIASKPRYIDLKNYINYSDQYIVRIKLINDKLYILNGIALGDTPDSEDEESNESKLEDKQAILTFDFNNGNLITKTAISKRYILQDYSVSQSGKVSFTATDTDNRNQIELYVVESNKKFVRLSVPSGVKDSCWSSNLLYYQFNDSIYTYSEDQRISNLVYKNPIDNIVGIDCLNNSLLFSTKPKTGQDSDLRWFVLTDADLKSDETRTENLLPITDDRVAGINYAYSFKNTVIVKLVSAGTECNASGDEQQKVVDYLQKLGIATAEFNFTINHVC